MLLPDIPPMPPTLSNQEKSQDKKYSKTKVGKLFKKPKPPTSLSEEKEKTMFQDISIEETNALRLKLGLKPLK